MSSISIIIFAFLLLLQTTFVSSPSRGRAGTGGLASTVDERDRGVEKCATWMKTLRNGLTAARVSERLRLLIILPLTNVHLSK